MNTAHAQMSQSRILAAYLGDIRFELVKMFRTPAFAIPTLMFPLMFYLLFGVFMGSMRGNAELAQYTFAAYGVFGAVAPGLFGFGVSLAFDREQGLLTFRQAIPMPSGSYLLARMATAMIFVAIGSLLLLALAIFVAHVPLTFTQGVMVFLVNVIGVLPFCAMGLFVGSLVSGQAAPGIVNLIYLPMSFLSGLWVPLQFLGKVIPGIAPVWPSYHLLQLARDAVGATTVGSTANHIGALVGVTVLFYYLAVRRLSGRGIRLLGPARSDSSFPLRRALTAGMFWISVGLVIAGFIGGNAPRPTNAAATSKDATEEGSGSAATETANSSAPIGVAAPGIPVISEFENGSERTSYGMGWHAADDKMRGGNSTITQRLVGGGAQNSKSALEVTGEVGTAIQYPFVGTSFIPNGSQDVPFEKQGLMDYSGKTTLSFYVRGDGQMYTVVFIGPVMEGMPGMYGFVAGADWQEVRIPLKDVANADLRRVKLISIGSMNPGAFRFQIDNVRLD
jgi:ABC-2 type transport system permease protein